MISAEKIIHGNILIARFDGLFYRNDWPDKYCEGYCVGLANRLKPITELEETEILKVGNSFDYHTSWNSILQAWFQFQNRYNRTIHSYKLLHTSFWKEFVAGLYNANIEQAWKGLAKGAHWYLGSYYL